ncbi:MAG: LLM class flavin-dependent oxidoreductase [Candidatus Bathyarchaeia archaeon]
MLRRTLLMERLDFDHVWVPDHLVLLDRGSICLDAWTILSGFAVKTRRIRLGTSVSDPYRRHPAVFAQTVGTLDQISKGRVILGLGLGEAQNLIPYGISYDRSVARLREAVEVMRSLWSGRAVDFKGGFYSLRKAFIQAVPVQKPHPPIFIAANSPKTRMLAGALGDGWMAEMMTPQRYREDLKDVRRGAEEAGRSLRGFRIVYHGPLSIAEDREEAWSMIEKLARSLFLWWPKQLEIYGYKVTREFDWSHLLVEEDTAKKIEEHLGEVPEEVARDITIYGTVDDCIGRIEDYIEAGVTDFAFFMEFQDKYRADEVLKMMGEKIVPYFKGLD